MRKLYEEFFQIPKHGKIRENVMIMRVALTVATMVMCLAAMSITAYAYFTHDVTSHSGVFRAAVFEIKVAVEIVDADGQSITVQTVTSDYRKYVTSLQAGQEYTVTIRPNISSTTETGFVILSATDCALTYHTQQLGVDANAEGGRNDVVTFKLSVSRDTDVYFDSHWGTSSHYPAYQDKGDQDELYITRDEEVFLQIGTPDPSEEGEESVDSEENTAPEEDDVPEADNTPEVNDAPEADNTPEVDDAPEEGDIPEVDDVPEENDAFEENTTPEEGTDPEETIE